ncbi:hypothetical protein CPC08DRAFT_749620 [Agrocybe pediades]|nr:hypothetical protein CPC08DRAFT_749620 [Agrocybe pediades]
MLTYRGFSAWITVDGAALPEYDVSFDHQDRRASCWIAGLEGKKFQIFWQDNEGTTESCAYIDLDGEKVSGRFLWGKGIASRSGRRSSLNTEQPFVFQKIADGVERSPSRTGDNSGGEIIVKIKKIKIKGGRKANRIEPARSVLGKRKAGEMCVGYGPDEKYHEQYPTTWDFEPCEETYPGSGKAATHVSFVFRYTSLETLASQMLVPSKQLMTLPTSGTTAGGDNSDTSPEADSSPLPSKRAKRNASASQSTSVSQSLSTRRRPSSENKRNARRTVTPTTTNVLATYSGESQFFLPRIPSFQFASETTQNSDSTPSSTSFGSPDA